MAAAEIAAVAEMPPGADESRLGAAVVYALGAVLYFIARELLEVDFIISPPFYGLLVIAASYFRRRLLASAVILICWSIAVIPDGKGPLEGGHTAQVHTLGFGAGARTMLLLRRWIPPRVALESVAIIMIVVGVWYYFVYETPELEGPWLWFVVFLAGAGALAGSELLSRRKAP